LKLHLRAIWHLGFESHLYMQECITITILIFHGDLKRMEIFNKNGIFVWVSACMLRHVYRGKNAIHIATLTCNGDLKKREICKWNYIFKQFDNWALGPIYTCMSAILICHRDLKRMKIFNWNCIFVWVAACMLRHIYPFKNAIHIATFTCNGNLKRMEIWNFQLKLYLQAIWHLGTESHLYMQECIKIGILICHEDLKEWKFSTEIASLCELTSVS